MGIAMRIETERLVLREFTADDEPTMLAIRSDPEFGRYYDPSIATPEMTHHLHGWFIDWQREQPRRRFQLAITLRGSDEPIGSVGIRRKPENEFEADIGYELHIDRWHRGYATEAARAVVAYGFEALGLHRVSSWCIAENAASAQVLERAGLRLEGRLRDNEQFRGRWWDTLLFGVLAEEWERSAGASALRRGEHAFDK